MNNTNSIKPGVDLLGIKPEMAVAHSIVAYIFNSRGYPCVVTSGVEGRHTDYSRHYVGCAMDFRIRHIADPKVIADKVREALGGQYYVSLSDVCLHVAFKPRQLEQ